MNISKTTFIITLISLSLAASIAPPSALLQEMVALPTPLYIPLELQVTPSSQTVTSSDNWRAEWTVRISGGQGTYTLEIWFGDGSYLKRPGVNPGTYYYLWYYDNDPVKTYYQTWKISGVGGPKTTNTSVYRSPN